MRGPVLQRAVVVENVLTPRSGSVDVQVAQQLPNGYTGWINMHGDGVGGALDGVQMLNDPMNSVLQDYRNKVSMVAKHSDCGDQCTTTVKVRLKSTRTQYFIADGSGFGFQRELC